MTLRGKISLALGGVFLAGLLGVSLVVRNQLDAHARAASLEKAGLMMSSALAMRKYTTDQIRPRLIKELDRAFHPQTVPAYAATEMFNSLRANNQDYTYKEATLNPSNPRDRATDWEADIVEHFRNHPEDKEKVGERGSATGGILYVARPIVVNDASCLSCHGDPKDLPATVRAKYGDQKGLGWKMDEVVGAQIASVPTKVADDRAASQFNTFLIVTVTIFALLLIVLNVLLNHFVVKPIKKVALAAENASTGSAVDVEIPASSDDEVGQLAQSFNRMSRSLKKAMEMIGHDK